MPRGRRRDPDIDRRILDATFGLMTGQGRTDASVDEIARTAGVAKQTIYRRWPSRSDLALDALLVGSLDSTPFRETGSARTELRAHMRQVVKLFSGPTGALLKQVIGDAQADPALEAAFLERFWAPRRELSRGCLARAADRGELRADLDPEVVLDALYGPLWARLLLGHQPLSLRLVDRLLDTVWPGIVASPAG